MYLPYILFHYTEKYFKCAFKLTGGSWFNYDEIKLSAKNNEHSDSLSGEKKRLGLWGYSGFKLEQRHFPIWKARQHHKAHHLGACIAWKVLWESHIEVS